MVFNRLFFILYVAGLSISELSECLNLLLDLGIAPKKRFLSFIFSPDYSSLYIDFLSPIGVGESENFDS